MDNIYLVGFMGTGKSSCGRITARMLGRKFFDLDAFIEKAEGMDINHIFSEKGEGYFREAETRALLSVSKMGKAVVSCGGGAVIKPQNIELMKKTGMIICLSASPEVILERAGRSGTRPLLNTPDPLSRIKTLLAERSCFYAQADLSINTTSMSLQESAEAIIQAYRKNGQGNNGAESGKPDSP